MLQVNRRKQAREMKRLIGADMELYSLWPRTYGLIPRRRRGLSLFLYLFFTVHTFPAVFLYRIQTFLYEANFHPLATLVSRINHTLFGVTIGNHVRTTGGLQLGHGHVVIDGFTFLGDNVTVNPFVTIGIGNSEQNLFGLWGPVIGNNVHIGTGAKILGKVNIGDFAKIGANAVIVHDVPAYHTAVGVPARSFPTAGKAADPSVAHQGED